MNSDELYSKKYQYETIIKKLNEVLNNLDDCYSNLLSCKKKINDCVKVNDNYFSYKDFENIIKVINNKRSKIRNNILPKTRNQYNNILSKIANL